MTTAVLGRPASRRRLAGLVPASPSLVRALPGTALFAGTAALLAVGVLPVVDGELTVTGVTLGLLATVLARLVDRGAAASEAPLVVPVVQFGAVALLAAGTGSSPTLFPPVGPFLSRACTPRRRALAVA